MKRLLSVAFLLLLAGCSSPADVERLHAEEMSKYQRDIETAQEWNTHVLGIPASGWLAIVILSILLAAVLLICAGVWAYGVQERRARDRRLRAEGLFALEQARIERGRCQVCGADPEIATSVQKAERKR
jgi:uncharacterized protein HemY